MIFDTINHSLTSPGEAIGKEESDRLMDELHCKVIGIMCYDMKHTDEPGLLYGVDIAKADPYITKENKSGGPDRYGGGFNVWA